MWPIDARTGLLPSLQLPVFPFWQQMLAQTTAFHQPIFHQHQLSALSLAPKPLASPSASAGATKAPKLFRPWQDDSEAEDTPPPSAAVVAAASSPAAVNRPSILPRDLAQLLGGGATDPATLETVATNLGRVADGHRCVFCGKVYSRKYGLKIHLRTHTGFKPLRCGVCRRPFGDPSNLNKHTRLHAQTTAACPCPRCGKVLIRRRDLERHLKARHGVDLETEEGLVEEELEV